MPVDRNWADLKEGVVDNIDRAVANSDLELDWEQISQDFGKVPDCMGSEGCGANHICLGGKCIQGNLAPEGGPGVPNVPGGTTGGSNCTQQKPDSCKECQAATQPKCGNDQKCRITSINQCCGGNLYHCAFTDCPQCEPCEEPYKRCTTFCTNFKAIFGRSAGECESKYGENQDCGECSDCKPTGTSVNNTDPHHCVPKEPGDGPCHCHPNRSGCPDCHECIREGPNSGQCQKRTGLCKDCANCTVTCPCGTEVNCRGCWEHYRNGLVAPAQCREDCYKKFCIDKEPLTHTGQPACPPQKDPCKADPGNPCEKFCKCIVVHIDPDRRWPDDPFICPDGWGCTLEGEATITVAKPTGNETVAWWHIRMCQYDPDNPKCEECDCHCSNDCPDCHVCGNDGKCWYDPACGQACGIGSTRCGESCCPPGQECKPTECIEFTDACHGIHTKVCGPAGSSWGLAHQADISAEDAVCDRFHTHCEITVNGIGTGHVHYDCQAGLPGPTPGGGYTCVVPVVP